MLLVHVLGLPLGSPPEHLFHRHQHFKQALLTATRAAPIIDFNDALNTLGT